MTEVERDDLSETKSIKNDEPNLFANQRKSEHVSYNYNLQDELNKSTEW